MSPYIRLCNNPELIVGIERGKAFELFDGIEKLGFDITETDILGKTVFHQAIEGLNIPLIDYCVAKGMEFASLDTEEISAIYLLLRDNPICRDFKEGNISLIEEQLGRLIEHGCNINYQNHFGEGILHQLVRDPMFKKYPIRLARKYKIDLSLKNRVGETAYDIAVRRNLPDRVLLLLK